MGGDGENEKKKLFLVVCVSFLTSFLTMTFLCYDFYDFHVDNKKMAETFYHDSYWEKTLIWYDAYVESYSDVYEDIDNFSNQFYSAMTAWSYFPKGSVTHAVEHSASHTEGRKTTVDLSLKSNVGIGDLKSAFSHEWENSDETTVKTSYTYSPVPGIWYKLYQTYEKETITGYQCDVEKVRQVSGIHCTEAEAKKNLSVGVTSFSPKEQIYEIISECFGVFVDTSDTNPYKN